MTSEFIEYVFFYAQIMKIPVLSVFSQYCQNKKSLLKTVPVRVLEIKDQTKSIILHYQTLLQIFDTYVVLDFLGLLKLELVWSKTFKTFTVSLRLYGF